MKKVMLTDREFDKVSNALKNENSSYYLMKLKKAFNKIKEEGKKKFSIYMIGEYGDAELVGVTDTYDEAKRKVSNIEDVRDLKFVDFKIVEESVNSLNESVGKEISYDEFKELTEDDIPESSIEYYGYCDDLCVNMNGNLVYIWKNPANRYDHTYFRISVKTKRMKNPKNSCNDSSFRFEDIQKRVKEYHETFETAPTDKVSVGDIFVYQYGYEANIVHFYKVKKILGSTMVELVEMSKHTENEGGYYDPSQGEAQSSCGTHEIGKPMKKSIYLYRGEPHIRISDYGSCYLWDGEPVGEYNYH